uniref:Uncharacterized protein n=1 Tax=Tanacetum cinerariifolium TaxID=118510 RepID=A0A699HZI1_TANCI|nr:hypothetical protein [Tanacetum cinerariifolium]
MKVIVGDFMQLSLEVTWRLQEKLREEEFLSSQGLDQAFFDSINKDPFSSPQWVNLFQINENVYRDLVRELFASFEFDASHCRYDPNHLGVRFRLGGEQREMSLLELRWRVSLYSKRQSRESMTLTREVEEEDDEANEAAGGDAGNEGTTGTFKNIGDNV